MNIKQASGRKPAGAILKGSAIAAFLAGLSGCALSPSVNIMGSYFPAWIICCALGAAVTAFAHYLFSRWNIIDQLWPLPLLYPCLTAFVSCSLWLAFFR